MGKVNRSFRFIRKQFVAQESVARQPLEEAPCSGYEKGLPSFKAEGLYFVFFMVLM